MFGAQVAQQHLAGARVHSAGDAQTLGPGLGADDPGHFVIDFVSVDVHTCILPNVDNRWHKDPLNALSLIHFPHHLRFARWGGHSAGGFVGDAHL